MSIPTNPLLAGALSVVIAFLNLQPVAMADGHDEVMEVVMRYANLEGDLEEQAKLIRSDRVMITDVRQSDQAKNLEIQLAARKANNEAGGGEAKWITEVESPQVQLYGNVAVVSLMRRFHIYPPGAAPIDTPPHWLTLVLVQDRGNWGIAHTHLSPLPEETN